MTQKMCKSEEVHDVFPEGSPGGANVDENGEEHWGLNSRAILALNTATIHDVDRSMQTFMGRDLERKTELETLREKVEAQGKEITDLQERLKRAA
jgi:hypothetical protein